MGIFTLCWFAIKACWRLLKMLLGALSSLDFASDNIFTQLILMLVLVVVAPVLVNVVDKGIIIFKWLLSKFE